MKGKVIPDKESITECIPFYPHEFVQRESDLGILDYSSLPVTGASVRDLDPLERERLRQMVERYGGDKSLSGLSDEELDGALGFIRREHGRQSVTVTGLLMIGKEQAIRSSLPVHEVAFQVMNGVRVKVNEFYRMAGRPRIIPEATILQSLFVY